jgi:hypothetical protein
VDYEYYPLQLGEDNWVIFKVDTHHYKLPDKAYHIRKYGGVLCCDCLATGKCKHLDLINPKKELF